MILFFTAFKSKKVTTEQPFCYLFCELKLIDLNNLLYMMATVMRRIDEIEISLDELIKRFMVLEDKKLDEKYLIFDNNNKNKKINKNKKKIQNVDSPTKNLNNVSVLLHSFINLLPLYQITCKLSGRAVKG